MNDGGGGGERRNRLPANLTILKNCVRPRRQLPIAAVQVRYALFSCVTNLVSSGLWSQITMNRVCAKVYETRVFKV